MGRSNILPSRGRDGDFSVEVVEVVFTIDTFLYCSMYVDMSLVMFERVSRHIHQVFIV